ncbi:MAG: TetR/AcrR family transcriptional regulator [Arthrobacter sp.]|nr:TetR/AcrR family transcriptional regulator [Arthrobacter sp.]
MPKLSDEARRERRGRIALAALRAFSRKGIAGTSMADIIAEAGLSAGSIYSHFDSKAQLMRFAAREMMEVRGEAFLAATVDAETPPGPQEVLRRMVHEVLPDEFGQVLVGIFAEAATNPELLEVVGENLQGAKEMVARFMLPWARGKAGVGRWEGLDAADLAGRAADATLLCAHGILLRRSLQPDVDVDALVDDLLVGWD